MKGAPVAHSELLLAVGKIVQNVAICEVLMFSTFRVLAECKAEVAQAIFYTLDAFPARVQLLRRVSSCMASASEKGEVEAVIRAVEKANAQRREVAHALVVVQENGSDASTLHLFKPKSGEEPRPISQAWLAQCVRETAKAIESANQAYENICGLRNIPAEVSFG